MVVAGMWVSDCRVVNLLECLTYRDLWSGNSLARTGLHGASIKVSENGMVGGGDDNCCGVTCLEPQGQAGLLELVPTHIIPSWSL